MTKLMLVASLVAAHAVPASADPVLVEIDRETIGSETDLRPPSAVEAEARRAERARQARDNPLATTERWGGGIRITGLSGIGALPGVNYGVEVAGVLRREQLFGELALGRWIPEDRYIVTETPDHVDLALDVWTVRAGWASMRMPLRGWVLLEVGEIAGARAMPGVVSRMVMGQTPQHRQWRAAGGGLGVAWPMSDMARLVGTLELAIPLQRERVMLDQYGAFEADWMSARYSIGLEVGWR